MKNVLIEGARLGFEKVGRGCVVATQSGQPRYATISEMVTRIQSFPEARMLVTAASGAAGRLRGEEEAVLVPESEPP